MLKIFKKIKNLKYKNKKKGIALLISITVMTLLLSISFSISNIVLRQIRITNINNESKPAFYIADSAIECAMYYDTLATVPNPGGGLEINNKEFSTTIFGTTSTELFASQVIKCGLGAPLGLQKIPKTLPSGNPAAVTTFDINYGNDQCAKVEVIRTDVQTWITSRGYNTGINTAGDGCDLSKPDTRRLVERGLTITY